MKRLTATQKKWNNKEGNSANHIMPGTLNNEATPRTDVTNTD